MKKIGEQEVQGVFSKYLERAIRKRYGEDFSYAYGEFNGMQDKKYADYFASVNSVNILIEFKEFIDEIKAEQKKTLREPLCKYLPDELIGVSYQSHFIAWREKNTESVIVSFNRYVSKVCKLFGITLYENFPNVAIDVFLDDFMNRNIGAGNEQFSKYLYHLSGIAGDEGNEFSGMLLSFDPETGEMRNTVFYMFSELIELSEKMISDSKDDFIKPKGPDTSGGGLKFN